MAATLAVCRMTKRVMVILVDLVIQSSAGIVKSRWIKIHGKMCKMTVMTMILDPGILDITARSRGMMVQVAGTEYSRTEDAAKIRQIGTMMRSGIVDIIPSPHVASDTVRKGRVQKVMVQDATSSTTAVATKEVFVQVVADQGMCI